MYKKEYWMGFSKAQIIIGGDPKTLTLCIYEQGMRPIFLRHYELNLADFHQLKHDIDSVNEKVSMQLGEHTNLYLDVHHMWLDLRIEMARLRDLN